jgi:hypothetical protein
MISILPVIIVLVIVSAIYSIPFICENHNIPADIIPLRDAHKFNNMKPLQQRDYLIKKYLAGYDQKRLKAQGWKIAFKGFKSDMTCLDFKYREGDVYTYDGEPIPCRCGFHACLYPKDVATYYASAGNKYHIVFLKDVAKYHRSWWDSKVCAKTIKIGPRIDHRYITK